MFSGSYLKVEDRTRRCRPCFTEWKRNPHPVFSLKTGMFIMTLPPL
jgi:hypothetical protein